MATTTRRRTTDTAAAGIGAPAPRQPRTTPDPGPRFSRMIHHVLGWLLAAAATALAASGQIEYAISADITDWRRYLVPAILEIAAVFLILGGYLRACDGDSPTLLWLLAAAITGFATWTNLTHGGPRAGRIYAAATVVTFVLWLLKLRDRYRAARRRSGLIDVPTAKFRLVRWLVMPGLTVRAWLLAVEYSLQDPDRALRYAHLWHDTVRDAGAATGGTRRAQRRTGIRAAALAVRHAHITESQQAAPSTVARAAGTSPPGIAPAATRLPTARPAQSANGHLSTSGVSARADGPAGPVRRRQPPDRVLTERQPAAATTIELRSALGAELGDAPTRPVPSAAAYQPGSDQDAAMYAAWLQGVAAGREPNGADLARAAGRSADTSGIGRRAARRYREAHSTTTTARP
ncbi:DUF2637 domain-containing protein [Dactylosporangium sp. CA-092794]|uniref:DUF2637 domain-containing protein n=1 Tax=Dactylosporangium sp. CA-092794 TaxID=3239929 RepID=UPI003D8ABCD3